jgi:hypothetical protein
LNSRAVVLIEHPRLERQLVSLERKVTRGGRGTIDHIRGGHDDIANAVAGACVLALEHGTAMPLHRLQAYAAGSSFDPLATAEENAVALMREETPIGHFTGSGLAPTCHPDRRLLETYAKS